MLADHHPPQRGRSTRPRQCEWMETRIGEHRSPLQAIFIWSDRAIDRGDLRELEKERYESQRSLNWLGKGGDDNEEEGRKHGAHGAAT